MKIVQKVEENAAAAAAAVAAFAVQDEDAEADHDAEPGGQRTKALAAGSEETKVKTKAPLLSPRNTRRGV